MTAPHPPHAWLAPPAPGAVIDLNSDVGEGFDGDEAILGVVTSANVACGLHAGDPQLMATTVALAARNAVAVGAHVSYPDREHFGRRDLELAPTQLRACVSDQLGALDVIARAAGTAVAYVKPHGALYNRIVHDADQAAAVVAAIATFDRELALLTLPDGEAVAAARRAGVPVVAEGYADRAYTAAGTLVPRARDCAVLDDDRLVAQRAIALATGGEIHTIDGDPIVVNVRSICIHGDTPGAARRSARIRAALLDAGVSLAPFTTPGR